MGNDQIEITKRWHDFLQSVAAEPKTLDGLESACREAKAKLSSLISWAKAEKFSARANRATKSAVEAEKSEIKAAVEIAAIARKWASPKK